MYHYRCCHRNDRSTRDSSRVEDNAASTAAVEETNTGDDASVETGTDDDEALLPTQPAPSSLRKQGFSARKSMAMETLYLNDGTMAQTM